MQIKIEQFKLWRGVDVAAKENDIFKTALLISDYSSQEVGIKHIQKNYGNPQSQAYKDLSRFKNRSSGIILFAKLILDEALKRLPESDDAAAQRRMLTQLNETVTAVYVKPMHNAQKKIQDFLTQIKQIVTYDQHILITKEPSIALMTSLHTLLQLANTYINELASYKRYAARKYGVNPDALKVTLAELLTTTELKLQQSEQIAETAQQKTAALEIQAMLHAQYELILNQPDLAEHKIRSIGDLLNTTIGCLAQLGILKQRSSKCHSERESLNDLLNVFVRNDGQMLDRKYCLELLAEQQKALELLSSYLCLDQRNELDELLKQLHSPEPSQQLRTGLLYGISWLTALPTVTYRLLTPSSVQKMIDAALPATADSMAKQYICDKLRAIITHLNGQMAELDRQQSTLITQLSRGDAALGRGLERASCTVVQQVIVTSQVVAGAVEAYTACVNELQDNMDMVREIQGADTDLAVFIAINNTFLNKLMTFLARICSLFKTDVVRVIEGASQMREQLLERKRHYQQCIDEALNNIHNNSEIDSGMKKRLAQEFHVDSNASVEPRIDAPLKPQQAKLMIDNLTALFARAAPEAPSLEADETAQLPAFGNGKANAPQN